MNKTLRKVKHGWDQTANNAEFLQRSKMEALLQNVLTLCPQSILEPEVTVQRMATWFHGREHSQIIPPDILMAGGVLLEHSFCGLKWPRGSLGLLTRFAHLDGHPVSSLGLPRDHYKQPIYQNL